MIFEIRNIEVTYYSILETFNILNIFWGKYDWFFFKKFFHIIAWRFYKYSKTKRKCKVVKLRLFKVILLKNLKKKIIVRTRNKKNNRFTICRYSQMKWKNSVLSFIDLKQSSILEQTFIMNLSPLSFFSFHRTIYIASKFRVSLHKTNWK